MAQGGVTMKHVTTTMNRGIELDGTQTETKGLETSKLVIGVIALMAGLIGIWGITCLIGGVLSTDSLLEIGRSWLTAVTGH